MKRETSAKRENRSIEDIIKYEGIKSKGFGTIPKFIMHDRELSIESKAIYGYFNSLCGSGAETFPARDTILSALRLSKDGYYSHYKALIEQGYIEVTKTNPFRIKSGNIYTIISTPKKLKELSGVQNDESQSKLITEGIDSYGYGILPKAVMIDERLDIKAKGLYCYLASYAGAGTTVYPERENILYHLNISEKTYYRYYNELIDCNYITPVQRKITGRFSVCDYILNQKPDEQIGAITQAQRLELYKKKTPNSKKDDIVESRIKPGSTANIEKGNNAPDSKNQDTVERRKKTEIILAETTKGATVPYGKKQDSIIQDSKKPDGRNQDTVNNSNSINKYSTNSKINQSIIRKNKKQERRIDLNNDNQNQKDESEIRQIIKDNDGIPYEFLDNKTLITDTVHILTGWNEYTKDTDSKNFEDLDHSSFSLANQCLIDMLSCDYGIYKGARVSNNHIRERINEIIEIFDNDYFDDFPFDVSINTFLALFLDEYKRTAEYHEIKFPIQHMKTCLFTFFTEFKFKHSVMINDATRVASGKDSLYQRRFISKKVVQTQAI